MSKAPNNQPLEFHWSSEACESLAAFIKQLPKKLVGVYLITSPTVRKYVGSSIDIRQRLRDYTGGKCRRQVRLEASFAKYGVGEHTFEILELCDMQNVREREAARGQLLDVLGKNGLNCALPKGESGHISKSQETRGKLSRANKGKLRTAEMRKKQSEMCKSLGIRPPNPAHNKGTRLSEETRMLMSQRVKDRISTAPNKYKAFICKDRYLIKQAIIDKRGTLILNKSTGIFYGSINEAAKAHSISGTTLLYKLKKSKHGNDTDLIILDTKGLHTMECLENKPYIKPTPEARRQEMVDRFGKTVVNMSTGIFYECITDAAIAHGLKRYALYSMLRGRRTNKTDLILVQLIALLLAASVLNLTIRPP